MAGFRKGGEAAQEAAASSGGGFAKVEYLSIEDDGQAAVRYLTDSPDWIFVNQHAGAPTKNKPADWPAERNWPASMPATCRYDPAFEGQYSDCYIDDAGLTNKWDRLCKPQVRVWALACLREEVVGTPELVAEGKCTEDQIGKRIGFRDQIRKVSRPIRDAEGKPTDQTEEIEERAIVVVNFAPNNYFNALQASFSIYGSVCDRDFIVKKVGKGKDVEYSNIALDSTPNLKPGTESWKRYETAIQEQGIDIEKIIAEKASDEYFALFFDPNKTPPSRGKADEKGEAARPEAPAAPADDVDQDRLAAMRDRVRGHAQPATAGAGASSEID